MDKRIHLRTDEIPTSWYNVLPDLPVPLPAVLHPGTLEPITPDDLAPIFPMSLIMQEFHPERWVDIPKEILEIYSQWRPTPLVRATRLESALSTKARIYYKDESLSPAGSHKPNTAVAQAYYNKTEGVKRLATETGAGQWGSALAFATGMFDLDCTVYMVKVSYEQKPYRGILIRTWGGEVFPSPSEKTNAGRAALADDPECAGSLGLAISEAVEDALTHDDTKYSLGSVLNHVLLHQTVVGLETKRQLELAGEEADVIVGCVGGGSNFGGLIMPFMPDKFDGKGPRCLAVEPAACPTLTKGPYRYDFGDVAKTTPLLKMYTLGHGFFPAPIHAGGLRYHGDAPLLCHLVSQGFVDAVAYPQSEVFKAAMLFAQTEGFISAPETSHAICGAIKEAQGAPEGKVIVIGYSGHGLLDLAAYDAWISGRIEDYEYPEEKIEEALKDLPEVE